MPSLFLIAASIFISASARLMKIFSVSGVFLVLLLPSHSQELFQARLEGTPNAHTLFWPTKTNYIYLFQMSEDLNQWHPAASYAIGDGTEQDLGLSKDETRLFYRVVETSFLIQPAPSQRVDLIDGVCFAFNLTALPTLPAKIRIYSRPWNQAAPWVQIGLLTDFATLRGIRTLRGSAIWIPSSVGDHEVKVEAVNALGDIMAGEQRRVIVGNNSPPTLSVTGLLDPAEIYGQRPRFTFNASDPDGDEIRRIRYFDNGVLLGDALVYNEVDSGAIPLATPRDFENEAHYLLKGQHNITAVAYDSRGAMSAISAPFSFTRTQGNSRPLLTVSSPQNGVVVQQGTPLVINFTASDPDGNQTLARVEAKNLSHPGNPFVRTVSDTTAPFGPTLSLNTAGWPPGSHTIKVTATDDRDELGSPSAVIPPPANYGTSSLPVFITIVVETPSSTGHAEFFASYIADGTSAIVSNAIFRGVFDSTFHFADGIASGLEISQGLVMTTGLAASWDDGDLPPPPQTPPFSEQTTTRWKTPGDFALQDRIAATTTADAAVLEFTLECQNGQLEIEYQFGSEEYEEFINDYNDAFIITVDGVVVNLVPDCSDLISVNTVHGGKKNSLGDYTVFPLNEHLFLNDDNDISPRATDQLKQAEYDGMSVRLRSHVFVSPGLHHIRIVIADVLDDKYDSALFLKRSSVRSISPQP